jgi:hypothetical protein
MMTWMTEQTFDIIFVITDNDGVSNHAQREVMTKGKQADL